MLKFFFTKVRKILCENDRTSYVHPYRETRPRTVHFPDLVFTAATLYIRVSTSSIYLWYLSLVSTSGIYL